MCDIGKVGIITYDVPHLKTEQVLSGLIIGGWKTKLMIYSIPFIKRRARVELFQHRPNQNNSILPEIIAQKHDIPYKKCCGDYEISNECDFYLIAGGGILTKECVRGKKIINAHPGIIPSSRGLDSFKWDIYEDKPLGVTLHYIDENVDKGVIISVIPAPVYKGDTLETLARRHYNNEINILSNFVFHLNNPINDFKNIPLCESRKRMGVEFEKKMLEKFPEYIKKWSC